MSDPFLVGQHQKLLRPAGDVGRSSGRNHGPRRQGGQPESHTRPVLRVVQVQTEAETAAENRRTQVENTHGHDEAAIEVVIAVEGCNANAIPPVVYNTKKKKKKVVIAVRVPWGTGYSDRSRDDQ